MYVCYVMCVCGGGWVGGGSAGVWGVVCGCVHMHGLVPILLKNVMSKLECCNIALVGCRIQNVLCM